MLVAQEVWYISKGQCKNRRAITVVYNLTPDRGRETVGFITAGYQPKLAPHIHPNALQNMFHLPSVEVTPSQFKQFLKKEESLFPTK